MKKTTRNLLVLSSLIVMTIGGGLLLLGSPPPKDSDITQKFEKVKPNLVRLKSMLDQDPNLRIVGLWGVEANEEKPTLGLKSLESAGINQERLNSYQAILKQVGLSAAIKDEGEYRFPFGGNGFASKGWRMAFVYRTKPIPPEELIENTDLFVNKKITSNSKTWVKAYRPLGDNWYVFIIW